MNLNLPLVVNSTVQGATQWPGGQGVLTAVATSFASATVTLQYRLPDGATYFSTAVTATANGVSTVFTLPQGLIQVVVSGGSPTGLYVNACLIPNTLN